MSRTPLDARYCLTTEDLNSSWLPFIFTNSMLKWTTLLLVMSVPDSPVREILHPYDVSQLNNMITAEIARADPAWSSSDQMIAILFSLAFYEAVWGERAECEMHMQNLSTLVRARGGLDQLEQSSNGLLVRVLLTVDYYLTWRTGRTASFGQSQSLPHH